MNFPRDTHKMDGQLIVVLSKTSVEKYWSSIQTRFMDNKVNHWSNSPLIKNLSLKIHPNHVCSADITTSLTNSSSAKEQFKETAGLFDVSSTSSCLFGSKHCSMPLKAASTDSLNLPLLKIYIKQIQVCQESNSCFPTLHANWLWL